MKIKGGFNPETMQKSVKIAKKMDNFDKFRLQNAPKTRFLEMFSLLRVSSNILVSKMGLLMNSSLLVRSECTEM